VGFRAISPGEPGWITRPHEPGAPARHVAELSELAVFAHSRANVWRYEPGAPARHVAELSELAVFAHSRANVWRYEPGARVYGAPPETEDERVELLGPAV